jgi:hypothetical protein
MFDEGTMGRSRTLSVHNVPVGTYKRFYRNTVEISENSENHLKAIVGGRQVAGRDGDSARAEKVAGKTQGEEKESEIALDTSSRGRRVINT